MNQLFSFEFRDPASLVDEIAARVPLVGGTAHLALVERPSTTQRLVRVETLRTPAEIFTPQVAEEELRRVIDGWPLPDVHPPQHASLLVIVRPGLCVFGPNEAQWFLADRYLNHLRSLYTGDCVLVTEHGWLDFMTRFADKTPALQPSA